MNVEFSEILDAFLYSRLCDDAWAYSNKPSRPGACISVTEAKDRNLKARSRKGNRKGRASSDELGREGIKY